MMLVYRLFYMPTLSVPCILDRSHELLKFMNIFLHDNYNIALFMIISSQITSYFFIIGCYFNWMNSNKSKMRAPLCLFILILLKWFHIIIYSDR